MRLGFILGFISREIAYVLKFGGCENIVKITLRNIKCYLILRFLNKFGTMRCHYEVKLQTLGKV